MDATATTEMVQVRRKPRLSPADFISNIPDDVLSHILSRLPLEDAVRTSILSKDWKYKWTSLYKLDLCDRHWKAAKRASFATFLNRKIPSIQFLRIFRVCCARVDMISIEENYFQGWLSAVLKHNLEIFIVELCYHTVVLPCDLLNSTCLRQFSVGSLGSTLNAAAKNIAPKLTDLRLNGVKIVSGSPTMTFTFPVLETLRLEYCEWVNVNSVEIYAPSLTSLWSSGRNIERDYDYSIVVSAPRLTTFHCPRFVPQKIILEQSSLVSEFLSGHICKSLDLRKVIGLRVRNLLNRFTYLEELFLVGDSVKDSKVPLRQLKKLRRLALHPCDAELLIELLHAAPSLESLAVSVREFRNYDYGALQFIPACIGSHLEVVAFRGFRMEAPQCDLAEFLLKNAKQLKKFRIDGVVDDDTCREVEDWLCNISRCSISPTLSAHKNLGDHYAPKGSRRMFKTVMF